MDLQTRKHTEILFLEVSRAAARKKIYALRAEQEGKSQLAKLFRAIAISEDAQAQRLLLQLRGQIDKTERNGKNAFGEEIPRLAAQYHVAANDAENAHERAMQSIFSQSTRVQQMHLSLKKKLDENRTDSTHSTSVHSADLLWQTRRTNTAQYVPPLHVAL